MSNRTPSVGTLVEAVAFAASKHRDQRRKDVAASPYINHPIALANVLANEGGVTNLTALCAAVLHDTVEDTDATVEEISSLFGKNVADIVDGVSKISLIKFESKEEAQAENIRKMILHRSFVKLSLD